MRKCPILPPVVALIVTLACDPESSAPTMTATGPITGTGTDGPALGADESGHAPAGSTANGSAAGDEHAATEADDSASDTEQESDHPREHFYVDGATLRDPCGDPLVLRGVNHMMVYADRPCSYCSEIAQTGANAVRMMWVTDIALSEAEAAVNQAVSLGMLPMLEIQDSTCDFGDALRRSVEFWLRPDSVEFVQRHAQHLLVNIANEPATIDDATFLDYFSKAVQALRNAGIHTPLVLDASGCGRNAEQLLALSPELRNADPDRNLIFSWHIYDSGSDQPDRIRERMGEAVDGNIPLIIGEFSAVGMPFCDAVPYATVIEAAQQHNIGYFPWSWTPGNQDCYNNGSSIMDMTSDNTFATLHSGWAQEVALTDTHSIRNTSIRSRFLETGSCERD